MAPDLRLRNFADYGRPFCAKCGHGKLVEELEIHENPIRMTREFIVRCHGEEERCELTEELLFVSTLERGWAFRSQQELPEPQKRLTDGGL